MIARKPFCLIAFLFVGLASGVGKQCVSNIRDDENLRRILFLERLLISRLCNKIENGNNESATFGNKKCLLNQSKFVKIREFF